MTAEPVEDGSLPDARRQLDDAIAGLCDPKPQTLPDGGLTFLDPLYVQLQDAVPGEKQHRSGIATSQAPLWVDAMQLLQEIDTAVAIWERPFPVLPGDLSAETPPVTVLRLKAIADRRWRPQDCRNILQIAEAVFSWSESINSLLFPEPRWTLPAACPQCNTRIVYRIDSAGERVRQPALQLSADGAWCQKCQSAWHPQFLARLLGFDPPEGVLE